MTWHIYVTRRPDPALAGGGIGAAEWWQRVMQDPSLIETDGPGTVAPVVWQGDDQTPGACLTWESGALCVRNPDDATICKLWEIADALGAHIEDDDGGLYDRNGIYLGDATETAMYA